MTLVKLNIVSKPQLSPLQNGYKYIIECLKCRIKIQAKVIFKAGDAEDSVGA